MLTNSEKVKKILDGGNHVRITYTDDRYEILHDYNLGCFFSNYIHRDEKHINDKDVKKITPIYKKPNFKVDDLVDVYDEYSNEYGNMFYISKITETGVILGNGSLVPFWAISHSI